MDVAGLVPGAHEGAGMGNQFLDDLRQADVLIHVIDVSGSTNEKGELVPAGSYDPAKDILFLEEELDFWYEGILKKGWERFARQVMQEQQDIKKALAKQLSGLKVTLAMIEDVTKLLNLDVQNPSSWTNEQLFELAGELRRRTKPMVIACNKIDVSSGRQNFSRLKSQFPELLLIPCSAESELALREAGRKGLIDYVPGERSFTVTGNINEKQQHALEFIQKNILDVYGEGTGVQKTLNAAVFDILKYVAIYPGGVGKLEDSEGRRLPDCFLMPPGTTALDFAFRLHTDFGKNFIRAVDVKTRRAVGKDYVLKNGDVVEIVSGK
jgi:hypothetical protein